MTEVADTILDELVSRIADEIERRAAEQLSGWISLCDVPEAYDIKIRWQTLKNRWYREVGAPRPSYVSPGIYKVRRSEIEAWLASLKAPAQEDVLLLEAIARRRAAGVGSVRLRVPETHDE